jgi:pyruvate,water dikinase
VCYVADPQLFRDAVAERSRAAEALAERIPPFLFEGEIAPIEIWPKRIAEGRARSVNADILKGIGGSPGRVVGTARIVMDTSNPDILNPGDILVAPITDPSWTPLFLADAGVVVDCRCGHEPFGDRIPQPRDPLRGLGESGPTHERS